MEIVCIIIFNGIKMFGYLTLIAILFFGTLTFIVNKYRWQFSARKSVFISYLTLGLIVFSGITHFGLYNQKWVWSGTITNNIIYALTSFLCIIVAIFSSNSIIEIGIKYALSIICIPISIILLMQMEKILDKRSKKVIFENSECWIDKKKQFLGPTMYYINTKKGLVASFQRIQFPDNGWLDELKVEELSDSQLIINYMNYGGEDSMILKIK